MLVPHWIGVIWELSLKGHRWRNAQSAAVFRSPRLQENLPLRAEQGRCCPAWATENGPDPQFRRAVLRHRKAQQGINRFSGERAKSKPIEPPRKLREIGTQAD
ncbi:MAG: hypothetical protein DCE87_11150 [Betaproteobacteria bacterium]|nr:MAG: hypothetical protein DCE87_11150 [Betaproteobacteria bacterium]